MTFDEFMFVVQDIVSTDYSTHSGKKVKMLVKQAWDTATEEVKKDHFKIGEAVMFPWYNDNNVRTWYAGTYKAGRIYFADDSSVAAVKYCKPFDPDKISKPWDEV